jgi:hypothetical protein
VTRPVPLRGGEASYRAIWPSRSGCCGVVGSSG